MGGRGNRRRFLALVAGTIGAAGTPGRGRAGDVGTLDYCYWKKTQGASCSSGRLLERWCEYCNDPGTGWTVTRCEWRVVGSC